MANRRCQKPGGEPCWRLWMTPKWPGTPPLCSFHRAGQWFWGPCKCSRQPPPSRAHRVLKSHALPRPPMSQSCQPWRGLLLPRFSNPSTPGTAPPDSSQAQTPPRQLGDVSRAIINAYPSEGLIEGWVRPTVGEGCLWVTQRAAATRCLGGHITAFPLTLPRTLGGLGHATIIILFT